MRYVLVHKFCEESGYTDKAVRRKMQEGVWTQGRHWRKAPDGHVFINVEEIERWVEGQQEPSSPSRPRSASSSRGLANAA